MRFHWGVVGAAEGCDLLIFHLRLKCLGKDRSLASLGSSYNSQLIWIMTCYIRYTIRPRRPTRPKVAPLSQSDRRIIAPLQYPF